MPAAPIAGGEVAVDGVDHAVKNVVACEEAALGDLIGD
jgi:hypothetical protein